MLVTYSVLCTCLKCCMVRIKYTAHPRVLLESAMMASGAETEVPSQWTYGSPDASSWHSPDNSSDCESRSGGSGDTACESDDSSHAKVAAAATTTGITFEFGMSTVGKCVLYLWRPAHIIS
jgi:hypothetical protein